MPSSIEICWIAWRLRKPGLSLLCVPHLQLDGHKAPPEKCLACGAKGSLFKRIDDFSNSENATKLNIFN